MASLAEPGRTRPHEASAKGLSRAPAGLREGARPVQRRRMTFPVTRSAASEARYAMTSATWRGVATR
jgi:hypothetical protein